MPPWDSLCDYQCPLTAHTPPDIPSESPLTEDSHGFPQVPHMAVPLDILLMASPQDVTSRVPG